MEQQLERLGLLYNPFEPAASGVPVGVELWLPDSWLNHVQPIINRLRTGKGTKALAILGEYGSGKTYLLRWLETVELPKHRIRPFFFDNPGVQFYDLANSLLRQVGRYEFAKMLWESVPLDVQIQKSMFDEGLIGWLRWVKRNRQQEQARDSLISAVKKAEITSEDEIAFRLAQIVLGTLDEPYFEYSHFVAGRKGAIVAEKEEAPYFKAIIRALQKAGQTKGIAFLIDEFEEISLQKVLTQRQSFDYLATMKRLINTANDEDFWLVVSMTRDAADKLRQLEPALWERFTSRGEFQFEIPQFGIDDATNLVRHRLEAARVHNAASVQPDFPFPADFASILRPATISQPRRLVQMFFWAIAIAESSTSDVGLPFSPDYLKRIENQLFPTESHPQEPLDEHDL